MRRLAPIGLVAVLAACEKSPETGRRQLLLVSEAHEMELGAASYQKVLATQLVSRDSREVDPLSRVGARIAAAAEKPEFHWEFNVIETASGVPARRLKHVTLVRRDPKRPDFPAGGYSTLFEGATGGHPLTASCVHSVR